jgi:hypothetical protein
MLYIIKWIPKDQDLTIDHTRRYEDLAEAITVARNLLQLQRAKIWIEDEKGELHGDDGLIRHRDQG